MKIYTTKEIIDKKKISRQTLYSWIKSGKLEEPKKDWRGYLQWSEKEIDLIEDIIREKTKNTYMKNIQKLSIEKRRYLGAKTQLLDFIEEIVNKNCSNVKSIADIFGGTGVVANRFNKKDIKIIVNDILYSNYISYNTWFSNEEVDWNKIRKIIRNMNTIKGTNNYASENFGGNYFTEENAKKIGAIREYIEDITETITFREKCILLTSLMYAMDKVANTCGHYDAFRKSLDTTMNLELILPEVDDEINKMNEIYRKDANELVKEIKADLVYIDTPYNSRQYSDAYHLLENIIEWKKPELKGVAKKMDRTHIKSDYCTVKAPKAFEELINNISSRYILVSYNNMAKKGVGRSNAKISHEEIIDILSKKGKVTIFEKSFKAYTTGKSKIKNHKELLYLCTCKEKETSNKYIKSCLNYTGGKYKLLKQIEPLFPKNINSAIDLFCGGLNVGINIKCNEILCVDKEKYLIDFYKAINEKNKEDILTEIETIIEEYGLSDTYRYGYKHYDSSSSDGLKEINEENYKKLKNDFNNCEDEAKKVIMFYVLIVFGFNNQIRFNKKNEFNIPVGKRDFNEKMRIKLVDFIEGVHKKKIAFECIDFKDINFEKLDKYDFIYADPPYLISCATYNSTWGEGEEKKLLEILDELNEKGKKFALSNVLEHNGTENSLLKEWSKKYKVHNLNYNYNNSNYQKKSKKSKTVEVLITNY